MGNAQASAPGGQGGGGRTPPRTTPAGRGLHQGLLDSNGAPPNGNQQVDESAEVQNGNGPVQNGNGSKPPENETAAPDLETRKPLTPLLPIPEDCMIEMLPTYANTALYGLTTLNLLVANTVAPVAQAGVVQSLLYLCPYTYIPLGVVSAILATAATKCHRFAGVASGFMLVQLLYVIALGYISTIIRMHLSFSIQSGVEDKDKISKVVLGVSTALCFVILVGWSILLPYPKCISLWSYIGPRKPEGAAAAMALSEEATEAAGVADRAAGKAVAIAKVANANAKLAKKAADDAVAAEGAGERASKAETDAAEASSKATQAAEGASGYAVNAEKAADEAAESRRRAEAASEKAAKSLQDAQSAEDKTRILSDASNRV